MKSKKYRFHLFIFLCYLSIFILAPFQTHKLYSSEVSEPPDYRIEDYKSPVPRTLKGAKVISTSEAETLLFNHSSVFIDVNPRAPRPALLSEDTLWRDVPHSSIEGAYWLPNVGYGILSPEVETYFKSRLERLTENNKNRSIVFFCQKECWMSWNAAKRALSLGYKSVSWFPEGTDGWQMQGNSLISVEPVP